MSKGNSAVELHAPDYVADSSVPIFDRRRKAIKKKIGYATMFVDDVSTTAILYINMFPRDTKLHLSTLFNSGDEWSSLVVKEDGQFRHMEGSILK